MTNEDATGSGNMNLPGFGRRPWYEPDANVNLNNLPDLIGSRGNQPPSGDAISDGEKGDPHIDVEEDASISVEVEGAPAVATAEIGDVPDSRDVVVTPGPVDLKIETKPPTVHLASAAMAGSGTLRIEAEVRTPESNATIVRIRANVERRAQAIQSIDDAIEVLEQFEGDDTEGLMADYALADLDHVRALLTLDTTAIADILDAERELHEAKDRLERVKDWFLKNGADVGRQAIVSGIIRALEFLVIGGG